MLFDIFKLVAAVGGIVFGIVKWILEQNKKNELKEMYEVRLKEKDERKTLTKFIFALGLDFFECSVLTLLMDN